MKTKYPVVTRKLICWLTSLLLAFSSGLSAQSISTLPANTGIFKAQTLQNAKKNPTKLFLLAGFDFTRLKIDLAELLNKVHAKTGVTVTVHHTFAEELPPLFKFLKATNQLPELIMFAKDQSTNYLDLLYDMSALKQHDQYLSFSDDNKLINLNSGFYLGLYYNKSLIQTPVSDFSEFPPNSLAVNFNTAFTTQLFWHSSGLIHTDGSIPLDNIEQNLSKALYTFQSLYSKSIIPSSCLDNACITEGFLSQKIPYAIDGTWMYQSFHKSLGENLGFTRLPSLYNTPNLSLRIPQVLGSLTPLSEQQNKAVAMISRAIINASDVNEKGIFGSENKKSKIKKSTYVPKQFNFIGCLFDKMNPQMQRLNTLVVEAEITEFVQSMNLEECYG